MNTANTHVATTVPNISNQNIPDQPTVSVQTPLKSQASQNVQSEQQELEIKKQSLPIENNQTHTPTSSSTDSKPDQNANTNTSTDDDAGVPK
ncbi:MAG: hypothetical protein GAK29_03951 [Acinetobacter bereziniae]|uniref:Uncharacterized protein n=1 Tax=Acinetobacter bereziniae TaxID=106648 RepID=A0A833PC80_ACIBZ|nr:MAG: hypothetical protein GAK29_03951 [Acinetobacter bereziniae]